MYSWSHFQALSLRWLMKLRVQSGDQLNLGGYDFCFSLNLLTILSLILDLIPLVGINLQSEQMVHFSITSFSLCYSSLFNAQRYLALLITFGRSSWNKQTNWKCKFKISWLIHSLQTEHYRKCRTPKLIPVFI